MEDSSKSWITKSRSRLLRWYNAIHPLNVDIVGDFAGKEQFAVHGEALLLHCIKESRVDFDYGFQLLHAVHAVESFLRKLVQRGCNFHVLWFDDHEHLCIPRDAHNEHAYKYRLTRAVLIQHLANPSKVGDGNSICSYKFKDLDCDAFRSYLTRSALHFFMFSHGNATKTEEDPIPLECLSIGYRMAYAGYPVAFINDVEIRSSKVFASISTSPGNLAPMDADEEGAEANEEPASDDEAPSPGDDYLIADDVVEALSDDDDTFSDEDDSVLGDDDSVTSVSDNDAKSLPFEEGEGDLADTGLGLPSPEAIAAAKKEMRKVQEGSADALSAREMITVYGLSKALESASADSKRRAAVVIVHLVLLRYCKLPQRSFVRTSSSLGPGHDAFMAKFSSAACCALEGWFEGDLATTAWDAFDLFDGRLYHQICLSYVGLTLPESLHKEISRLAELLRSVSDFDLTADLPDYGENIQAGTARKAGKGAKARQKDMAQTQPFSSVLHFSHPVIDPYLKPVKLKTVEPEISVAKSKIFQELTHWHDAKKPVDPKFIPKPPGFFARKRNQKFMADTIAYSASLSGSTGKSIDPEIIVVQSQAEDKKPKAQASSGQDWKTALKEKSAAKTKVPATNKKQPVKSGKQKALEAAGALKAEKTEEKSVAVIAFWAKRCLEFEKEHSLVKRYIKAQKYLQDLSSTHATAVGSEVSLYLCHVLTLLQDSKSVSNKSIPDILAMLWSKAIETQRFPLTQEIAGQLLFVAKALEIPFNPSASLPSRKLAFTSSIGKAKLALPANTGALDFQLDFCGPYVERSFDSAPDSRVPFHPDAWQRKVLDAIDDNKSLFVVAPTSAGKTFISFYAMKKVLQASNDDVLVYVAPTKALVNQIAAEIQARFTKSYHNEGQEGKSVWAIHTRDYRVNNPHKCQILVTVPHVLQIMLLAPSNALKPTSWARRVKRIIFDEVHCIGQAEDGVVWEQLLLLAPCPIIALSATVGNPLEFKSWLEGAARVKGFDFEMVVHSSRYSDLRKFLYRSPPPPEFKGLASVERLPLPGLDAGDGDATRFAFVHPIGSIVVKDLDTLKDVNLEPRDCVSLWQCMVKHQSKGFPVDAALNPKGFFPKLVKKSDVVRWEEALKKQLGAWMLDSASPFEALRADLRGENYQELVRDDRSPSRNVLTASGFKSTKYDPSEFSLVLDLRANGALPAIIFNYDRYGCEKSIEGLLKALESSEAEYRANSAAWAAKVLEYEKWKRGREKMRFKAPKPTKKGKKDDDEGANKLDLAREEASRETSPWESFDPDAPLAEFSFADMTKISKEELEKRLESLTWRGIKVELVNALRRGIGVHHAGMNRQYRQAVEMLFRKGYLSVVVATGTLALGLNMPCKTVVFTGDSVYLSALNYRQASGRAGRRGFDLLGNVVFHGIPPHRSLEVMSARLPDLRGQFPTSVTLMLRLLTLLSGTNDSEYAANAVKSLLSQTRLYLGGPEAQLSILHHLRFSIDYLQRQSLLNAQGQPIGLSGLVGHLYFTENSVFALHSLLNNGYFHKLCAKINRPAKRNAILREIVLTLSHLFVRIPVVRYQDQKWLQNVVHRSPSIVVLPNLPNKAARILKKHNREALQIFHGYVSTYANQHLADVADDELPFTKIKVQTVQSDIDLQAVLPSQLETEIRSPFAALSGFTDKFETIGEMCQTVRSGVFLEESAIPYLRISEDERSGVPWNAYIYDFFKHGDLNALIRDNGIKGGDVWFRLKDFSLVLATIVASLSNFLNPDAETDDAAMIDVQDAGDAIEEKTAVEDSSSKGVNSVQGDVITLPVHDAATSAKPKKKKKAMDSWEDEEVSDPEADKANEGPAAAAPGWDEASGESLVNVHKAFTLLQAEFDEKFKKIWA